MVWGLIDLYEASFEVRYLKEALGLNDVMHSLFRDDAGDQKTFDMLRAVKQAYLPNKVLLFRGKQKAFEELDKTASYVGEMASAVPEDRPATFWCRQFACREPITSIEELESIIESA
jgi:uncharacterized protein YyaL (SSP411 family)